jgi:hypothetical protein
MQVRIFNQLAWLAGLAFALTITPAMAAPVPAKEEKKSPETPAEKVKKALDQNIANLDIDNQALGVAIDQLKEETKINFVIDRGTIANMGIDVDSVTVKAKIQGVKAKAGLRTILNQYGLSYAIVGDSVVITTEDMAIYRQLKQRVSIDLDKVPMDKAIKNLARETATNVLIDTRAQKDAQTAVTLQADDVQLETAIRLIGEAAGLKAVRMGNVVLMTTKAHATELRAEPELAPMPKFPGLDGPVPGGVALPPGGVGPGIAPALPAPPAKPGATSY